MPKVCLTFDDGPLQGTEDVLDALAAVGVPATFFLVGSKMASSQDKQRALVQRMLSERHRIGNHTYSHFPLKEQEYTQEYGDLSDPAKRRKFRENFERNEEYFFDLLKASLNFKLARLPGDGGTLRKGLYARETQQLGLAHVEWTFEFDTQVRTHVPWADWQGIAGVAASSQTLPKSGAVILFHDAHWHNKPSTLEALLRKLQANNYTFGHPDSASGDCL